MMLPTPLDAEQTSDRRALYTEIVSLGALSLIASFAMHNEGRPVGNMSELKNPTLQTIPSSDPPDKQDGHRRS